MGFLSSATMAAMTPAERIAKQGAQVGGAINSGIGSYYNAKSQKAGLEFQSHMAGVNARIAELGAERELYKGESEVAALTLRAGQLKSSQRTSMAANGIDLGEGSAGEVLASTDIMKEIDKNTIVANAVRSAWGYRTQGMNYQNEALIKGTSASGINPFMSATSTLLGSAGGVADSWYAWRKATEGK